MSGARVVIVLELDGSAEARVLAESFEAERLALYRLRWSRSATEILLLALLARLLDDAERRAA